MRNLPPIYDEIKEMEELSNSVSIELDELDEARKQVENEQFIMTSSEKFIRIREKGWDIRADLSNETLDFRRRRIITRQSTRLPITQKRVHEILKTLVGDTHYEERLDVINCEALFVFDATETAVNHEIDYTLERIIPLNITLSIARRVKSEMTIPSFLSVGSEITIHPMSIDDIDQHASANIKSFTRMTNEVTIKPL